MLTNDHPVKRYQFILALIVTLNIFLIFFCVQKIKSIDITGDEPHYLMISQSIIKDHDIALQNNYEQRDYAAFFRGEINANDRHTSSNSTKLNQYSLHNIGLSILLIPGLYLGNLNGAIAEILLAATALIGLLATILLKISGNQNQAAPLTTLAVLSIPTSLYAYIIGNEIILAATILFFFYQLYFKVNHDRKSAPIWWLGFLLAALPWIHIKYLLAALLLYLLVVLQDKKRSIPTPFNCHPKLDLGSSFYSLDSRSWSPRRDKPGMTGTGELHNDANLVLKLSLLPIISIIGLSLFMKHYYGSYSFTAQYPAEWPNLLNFIKGFFGFLFDESFGILIFNPLLVLFPAGLYATYRKNKPFALGSGLFVLLIYAENSLYANKIGWSPAGRMMVALIPILFIWLAYLLASLKKLWPKIIFLTLGTISLIIGGFYGINPGQSYNTGITNNLFLSIHDQIGINFSRLFPKLLGITDILPASNGWVSVTAHSWEKLLAWLLITAMINLWFVRSIDKTNTVK